MMFFVAVNMLHMISVVFHRGDKKVTFTHGSFFIHYNLSDTKAWQSIKAKIIAARGTAFIYDADHYVSVATNLKRNNQKGLGDKRG